MYGSLTYQPKALKSGRRLSTRFISGLKNFGKKEHGAKEEKKEHVEAKPEEPAATPAASGEAPKPEQPVLAAPIKIEEASDCNLRPFF